MKPMARGDLLQTVLSDVYNSLAARGVVLDSVSRVDFTSVEALLAAESGLVAKIDYQEVDPDKALAALLVGLGKWYAGSTLQDALNAAATLRIVLEKMTT